MPNDEVRLEVPAVPEFVRLARVTATGLASRIGFTYDEVEDLRLAIDELCFTLIGPNGRDSLLALVYRVIPGGLEVEGALTSDGPVPSLSEFAEQILAALVDEHDLERAGDGQVRFRLRKVHDPEPAPAGP